MKVRELIAELKKCPPDADVVFFSSWDDFQSVEEISPEDYDKNVVLGRDLPPELYARDYQYD